MNAQKPPARPERGQPDEGLHTWSPGGGERDKDGDMAITPDQFTELMRTAADGPGDAEDAHIRADAPMVDLLRSLGYGDAMDIFERMERWYA